MADRATTLSGRFQKVTLGPTTKILGAGTYTISGITRRIVDTSEFGVDCDIYEFASADGGTITLSDCAYDPTDDSQETLRTAVENATKLHPSINTSGIRFWINSTSFLAVGTSGHILLTRAGAVRADRNGLARTDFEGQVSGAWMWLTSD
jgi:hypothetical protein